jgi:hypothetical protein
MHPPFETVTDLHAQADVLRARRYGVIEVVDGRLVRVRLRPWPKIVSIPSVLLLGETRRRWLSGNRLWVYYNQPLGYSQFLAVRYVISSRDCTYATARVAARVLDEVARIKGTDALLCDVAFSRISDRLLVRWGWSPHKPQRFHRNYIKRFYGAYPARFGGTE